MKVTQIAGFLGSGKTTLMLKVSREIAENGKRKVALIVNEIGSIPVDGKVLEETGMNVKDIGGGCVCCDAAFSFANTLNILYRDFQTGQVIVEPTGVAIPRQLKQACLMVESGVELEAGPAIVLFDATRPEELLDMEGLGYLVSKQVDDADILAISKVDAVSESQAQKAAQMAKERNPKAEIVMLSTFENQGIDHLKDRILNWNP